VTVVVLIDERARVLLGKIHDLRARRIDHFAGRAIAHFAIFPPLALTGSRLKGERKLQRHRRYLGLLR